MLSEVDSGLANICVLCEETSFESEEMSAITQIQGRTLGSDRVRKTNIEPRSNRVNLYVHGVIFSTIRANFKHSAVIVIQHDNFRLSAKVLLNNGSYPCV